MAKKKDKSVRELARVGRFGVVGIINTAIDFFFLNLFSRLFGWSDLVANIPAVAIAMTFSFFANRAFVFHAEKDHKPIGRQALEFFPITAIGMFGIQTAVIFFLENIWTWPIHFAVTIAGLLGLTHFVDSQFIITNGVKVIATLTSLTWNYLMYKKVVFKKQ